MTVLSTPPARGGRQPVSRIDRAIDAHVGARIKLRRTLLGLTQTEAAAAIGMQYQGLQRYELGRVRIPAATLCRLAYVLDVPVGFFFDGITDELALPPLPHADDALARRESLDLLRRYYALSEDVRRHLGMLMGALARE